MTQGKMDLNRPSWDEYFTELCRVVAFRSPDQSTRLGAVIIGPDREVRSTGFNGFPRGFPDHQPSAHARPEKYTWTEHAERNAIFNAARHGVALQGCTLYIQKWPPCVDCARAIIQVGITRVVVGDYFLTKEEESRWGSSFDKTATLFGLCGVDLTFLYPENDR